MTRIWNKFTLLDTKLSNRAGKLNSVRNSRLSNGAGTPLKPRRRNEVSLRGRRKVFVGLSGGVDSSVSAALLKKDGYDVTGVFIKVWNSTSERLNPPKGGFNLFESCQAAEDRLDAMRVCAKLNISFIELNLEKEYKKEVVDYMIREYKAGKTPNPDVFCNRFIKFGAFYEWAVKNGADFVATGHYARIIEHKTWNMEQKKKSRSDVPCYMLHVACDSNKDQSYFLWQLRQEQLSHILFPVGGMLKQEVRKLAKKFDLPTAEKKDSQGLCFIGKVDMKEFLSQYIKPKKGNVRNERSEIIGTHGGAEFYTIGERLGISEKLRNNSGKKLNYCDSQAYYVVDKNMKKNLLIVSEKSSGGKLSRAMREIKIKDCNWILEAPRENGNYFARMRYRQPLQKCKIAFRYGRTQMLTFESPQTVAPGQSCVLYNVDVCLGGGIII